MTQSLPKIVSRPKKNPVRLDTPELPEMPKDVEAYIRGTLAELRISVREFYTPGKTFNHVAAARRHICNHLRGQGATVRQLSKWLDRCPSTIHYYLGEGIAIERKRVSQALIRLKQKEAKQ